MPYKDPAKRRESAKKSMQRARNKLRATREIMQLVGNGDIGPLREDSLSGATQMLAGIMATQGLTPQHIVAKVRELTDATAFKSLGEEIREVPDNHARNKAVELAIDLGSRAGLLPSDRQHNGAGSITLNVISYVSESPRTLTLDHVIDNEVDS